MAESFRRWESDPLFSAAEVVQDSADRMESVYRMLLHEKSLLKGDPSDPKLLTTIDYHRRDLATALGTTKWQLEDFERALNFSAMSDVSGLRENMISRHQQFVRAIQEQISNVEKSLEDSSVDNGNQSMQYVDFNEQDKDGFASFLSGVNSTDHHLRYDSESSIMRRFLDSTTASGFDEKSDEIVELKIDEIENSNTVDASHLEQPHNNLVGNNSRMFGSYTRPLGFESSVSLQVLAGDKECGLTDMGSTGTQDFQVEASRNRSNGYIGRIGNFGLPRYIWSSLERKVNRSFMKRRKDGDIVDSYELDLELGPSSSAFNLSQEEQVRRTWIWLASNLNICNRFPVDRWASIMQTFMQVGTYQRSYQRLQYFIRYNRFPIRLILGVCAAVILLGFLLLSVI